MLCLGIAAVFCSCGPSPVPRRVPEMFRLGLARETPCVLPMVALEKGFFAEEGLQVVVTEFPSGARALSAMLTGAVDVATVAEVPIAEAGFKHKDFRVFASIALVGDNHGIVAHRANGIEKPSDLRGKRVATQRLSSVHFFLHLFLLRHGMSENDVTLSFLPIEELVPALASDKVEAIAIRQPFVSAAAEKLGDQAVMFTLRGAYTRTQHMAGRVDFLREHPEAARRVARGLLRAEEFVAANRGEALRIVAARLKLAPEKLTNEWGQVRAVVSLAQSLLPQLEDEARWMLGTKLVSAETVPNYLELMDVEPLAAVAPESVSIIR